MYIICISYHRDISSYHVFVIILISYFRLLFPRLLNQTFRPYRSLEEEQILPSQAWQAGFFRWCNGSLGCLPFWNAQELSWFELYQYPCGLFVFEKAGETLNSVFLSWYFHGDSPVGMIKSPYELSIWTHQCCRRFLTGFSGSAFKSRSKQVIDSHGLTGYVWRHRLPSF